MSRTGKLLALASLLALAITVGATSTASAHIERASYWPAPAADFSIKPATGGGVPAKRSLYTALQKRPPGVTRVVCAGHPPSTRRLNRLKRRLRSLRRHHASKRRIRRMKQRVAGARRKFRGATRRNTSIRRLRKSLDSVRSHGYKIRPSQGAIHMSRRARRKLLSFNEKLVAKCNTNSIQTAVNRSRNNDRVVVMPGLYTEPRSRKAPTHDPKCRPLLQQNDEQSAEALSYAYQATCPNDQNLISVVGRRVGPGKDPQPPRFDRQGGIPNLGACVRCNVQIEGSGATPDDVTIDAGRVASGDKGPINPVKDVAIRADRADGFVLANVKTRHAGEHNIYVLESDGYLLDRFKTYYAGEYGVLTFVEDHGLMQNCDAAGHGDSGLYPGAGAETGEQTREGRRRYNQEIRNCDTHHNASGYSGTASNGIWLHHNNLYDNALGFTTDVFTASGHPGFPQDSDLIENNNFYSNNFNPYVRGSDVTPTVPVPVGTGLWIAGGNNNQVRNNRFWNNWRRGTMLFAVPDSVVCGPAAGGNEQYGCSAGKFSTSYRNRFYGNTMGRTPGNRRDPNGVDFWWDNFATNTNNCWYGNKGKDGTEASITSDPPRPLLPSNCATSRGLAGPAEESELLACLADFQYGNKQNCPWFKTPAEPQ